MNILYFVAGFLAAILLMNAFARRYTKKMVDKEVLRIKESLVTWDKQSEQLKRARGKESNGEERFRKEVLSEPPKE